MIWMAWTAVLAAPAAPWPCGTPQLAHQIRLTAPRTSPTLSPGDRADRDPLDLPNVARSMHFAVRWGSASSVDAVAVGRLLEALEAGWERFVVALAHPAPPGTDAFLFNVYLGDTGDGAPSSYGAGGYFSTDREGYPVVVVNPSMLADALQAAAVAVHELYHALQFTTARYPYDGVSAWWFEATAEWAAFDVAPTNPYVGRFLFAYAGLPERPLGFFASATSGSVDAYYPYGAFVFPVHVSDVGGPEPIRDTWLDPGTEPDPIEVLRARLAVDALDLDHVFLDHIARNATWDYPPGEAWAASVEAFTGYAGLDPVVARHAFAGTPAPASPGLRAPGHYGYNAILLRRPDSGSLHVSVVGQATGSLGSPAAFGARVVSVDVAGAPSYHDVPFDGVHGELTVDHVGTESAIWLMVGAWGTPVDPAVWMDERFGYTYELSVQPDASPVDTGQGTAPDAGRTAACGCAQPGSGLPPILALAVWAWLLSRRAAARIRTRT